MYMLVIHVDTCAERGQGEVFVIFDGKDAKAKDCGGLFFMAYLFQIFNLLMGSLLGHVFWNTPCFVLLVCGTVP